MTRGQDRTTLNIPASSAHGLRGAASQACRCEPAAHSHGPTALSPPDLATCVLATTTNVREVLGVPARPPTCAPASAPSVTATAKKTPGLQHTLPGSRHCGHGVGTRTDSGPLPPPCVNAPPSPRKKPPARSVGTKVTSRAGLRGPAVGAPVHQLKVTLDEVEQLVWRGVQLRSATFPADLFKVMQVAGVCGAASAATRPVTSARAAAKTDRNETIASRPPRRHAGWWRARMWATS